MAAERFAVGRALPTAFGVAVLVGAARVTLGTPDLGKAAAFFAGNVPSIAQAEAVMSLLCWMMVMVVAVIILAAGMRDLVGAVGVRQRPHRAGLLLVAALLLLAVSVVHRLEPSQTMCCGSDPAQIREVIDLAR